VTARAGGVGLWDWDLATNAVHFSREWKRQLGYTDDEVSDNMAEFDTRLHPDDRQIVSDEVAECLANPDRELSIEMRLRHRDGSYRWILTQGTVLRGDDGKATRVLGSHVDITALKQLELSLRQSEARYRDLVDALEQRVAQRTSELTDAYRESQNFAYAVAHDLKAPLRAMNGFSALLQQSAHDRLNKTEQDYLQRIQQGAVRMGVLIDGLLAYSRMEHREQQVRSLNVEEIVRETIESMASNIQEAGAEIDVAAEPTPVLADREGLQVALRNLIDNALKFSHDREPPRIEIRGHSTSDRYVLEVRDNGIGFDPEYADRIFEIFNRLHAVGYEGTGIGLALVRKAIHRMNGRVWAESAPGAGAAFFISLPLSKSIKASD
jgi:PAS domain S-box-containing protein